MADIIDFGDHSEQWHREHKALSADYARNRAILSDSAIRQNIVARIRSNRKIGAYLDKFAAAATDEDRLNAVNALYDLDLNKKDNLVREAAYQVMKVLRPQMADSIPAYDPAHAAQADKAYQDFPWQVAPGLSYAPDMQQAETKAAGRPRRQFHLPKIKGPGKHGALILNLAGGAAAAGAVYFTNSYTKIMFTDHMALSAPIELAASFAVGYGVTSYFTGLSKRSAKANIMGGIMLTAAIFVSPVVSDWIQDNSIFNHDPFINIPNKIAKAAGFGTYGPQQDETSMVQNRVTVASGRVADTAYQATVPLSRLRHHHGSGKPAPV